MQKWNGTLLRKFDDPTEGNASVGTTVVVRNTSNNSLAVIYDVDDVNSVQKNNPFVTDDFGRYSFYAPSGKYTIEFGDGSDSIEITLVDNTEHNELLNRNAVGAHDAIYTRRYDNVHSMVADTGHIVGNSYSTGLTKWTITDQETPLSLGNGLYALVQGNLYFEDYIRGDISSYYPELWTYGSPITVPNGLAIYGNIGGATINPNINIGTKYTVNITVGASPTGGTVSIRCRVGGDSRQLGVGTYQYDITATAQNTLLDTNRGDNGSAGSVISISIKQASADIGSLLTEANNYSQHTNIRCKLVFKSGSVYTLAAKDSYIVYVEGAGWYCEGNVQLKWSSAPTSGFAINVRGRHKYTDTYSTTVNQSNNIPLEGITIGENGNMIAGSGLMIGYAAARQSATDVVVTSKFTISRCNVFDFDDVIDIWNGSWAFELDRVNTIGGSWRTPSYFSGLDYGENIKLSRCFVADNHTRTDGTTGQVKLSAGGFNVFGGSFDNMRVVLDGDCNVKMYGVHFENPASTAKNKRFLEVVGSHVWCVINNPTIIIRNTDIYSTLFYCKAATNEDPHPKSGGLVISSPSIGSPTKYRPDLALIKSVSDSTTYEGEGYLELVGGGGRVYCDQIGVNSLNYNGNAIPISRSLVGGLRNYDFELGNLGEAPVGWETIKEGTQLGPILTTEEQKWVGSRCLKMQSSSNSAATYHSCRIRQKIPCKGGQLVLATLQRKVVLEHTNGSSGIITGVVSSVFEYFDIDGNVISQGNFKGGDFSANSSSDYNGWELIRHYDIVPAGAVSVSLTFNSFSKSDTIDKKINSYWDAIVMNVV